MRAISKLIIFIAVFVTAILGCASSANLTLGERNYPVQNSKLAAPIDIAINASSGLDLAFFEHWVATTDAKSCQFASDMFMRIFEGPRDKHLEVPLTIQKSNSETYIRIQSDRFLPGFCGWKLVSVAARHTKSDGSKVTYGIAHTSSKADKSTHYEMQCDLTNCMSVIRHSNGVRQVSSQLTLTSSSDKLKLTVLLKQ